MSCDALLTVMVFLFSILAGVVLVYLVYFFSDRNTIIAGGKRCKPTKEFLAILDDIENKTRRGKK